MPESFAARYNDGASARTQNVEVAISTEGLEIRDGGGQVLALWPAPTVALVDRPQAGLPLRLHRLDDPTARVTIQDRAALDALTAHCASLRRNVGLNRRSVMRVGALLCAAAASVAALVALVIPELASQIARSMPPELERRIGEGVADQLAALLGARDGRRLAAACTAPGGTAAVDALLARLSPEPAHQLAPVVRVIDARMVNAFAVPGAIVVVPRGMIDFNKAPDEFAGILAHELGHVALRHPIETLIKVAGVSALFSLLIGDVAGGTVILAVGDYMIRMNYTLPAEQAADDYATALLRRAGIDPAATAAAFERLLPKGAASTVLEKALSTHPPTEERVARFRAATLPGRPALAPAEWTAIKTICAPKPEPRAGG